ncbi:hypothetical protein Tco_0778969 [Tanacetum coccineum]
MVTGFSSKEKPHRSHDVVTSHQSVINSSTKKKHIMDQVKLMERILQMKNVVVLYWRLGVDPVQAENIAADEKESIPSEPEFCIEAGSVGNLALKKQQEEAEKDEKEQRCREKEEAQQKEKELALQKHASVLERFFKKSKSSSPMQSTYIAAEPSVAAGLFSHVEPTSLANVVLNWVCDGSDVVRKVLVVEAKWVNDEPRERIGTMHTSNGYMVEPSVVAGLFSHVEPTSLAKVVQNWVCGKL